MLKFWLSLWLVILSLEVQAQYSYHPNRYDTNVDSAQINGGLITNLNASNLTGTLPSSVLPVNPLIQQSLTLTNSNSATQTPVINFVNHYTSVNYTNYLMTGLYSGIGATFSFQDFLFNYASVIASNITSAGVFIGNAAGETNFLKLGATNSATSYLSPNTFATIPKFGLISCSLIITNATTVYLTNAITHYAIPMGCVYGPGTNYANAEMLVNGSDVVAVTNLAGTGNYTLLSSSFQGIQ